MGARTGHAYGIKLQITEALDNAVATVPGTLALARRAAGETGKRGFQQASAGKEANLAKLLAKGQTWTVGGTAQDPI